MTEKITSNVTYLQALSGKFISNLIERMISSIYLNFSNLLKKANKIKLLPREANIPNRTNTSRTQNKNIWYNIFGIKSNLTLK